MTSFEMPRSERLCAKADKISNNDMQDAVNTQYSQHSFHPELLQPSDSCLNSSRFYELPRELRDAVYNYALEPKAEFRVSSREDVPLSFQLPVMEFWARG